MIYLYVICFIAILLILGCITFINKTKDKINLSEKKIKNYESIIDQANDAMFVIDIANGKIYFFNSTAARLLGYTNDELSQLTLFDLHPKNFLEKSSRVIADAWERGGLIYSDIPLVTKTGNLLDVECSVKVAPFEGRPAIIIYARDITQRILLENELKEQRKIVDEKNKDINDSIEYSKRIQNSIFNNKEKLKEYAPQSFIFFKPRETVSGDFYWFTNFEIKQDLKADGNCYQYYAGTNLLVLAAADCTGHGIPGAFMSMIGISLLNQTIDNPEVNSAGKALDFLNYELKKSINRNKDENPIRDGMDISLCTIDVKDMRLEYAGANNPIYIIRENQLIELKATKQPITAHTDVAPAPFKNNLMELKKGDCIYLFTDGYADQFGGVMNKKFLYSRFKQTLIDINHEAMENQHQILEKIFKDWKGAEPQTDDILVIGVRV